MDKVSEISSSKLSDAIINYRQWGEMYYNVQNYGVLPGGVDVTTSLQALVDKATAENRTAIFFPPGDYRVTAITNDTRVFYVGDNARFIGGYTKTINLIGTNPGPNTGAPNPHAATHVTGGTDVIPNAVAGGNSGLFSGSDKEKLDTVARNANNYTHPATHPPSIIAQDASNRFVTDGEKQTWNGKADSSTLTSHINNNVIHVTQSDRDRWDAGGGGTSGPSFGKVNDIQAATANDMVTFAAGPGMAVSTDPATKTVTYTAQGSSAPGVHASTHLPGGSDPIQTATTTQFGLTQLNDAINSTSTTQAGTANAVRKAYDRGSNALTVAQTPASTTAPGRVQLNDTNTSTAVDQALTANAGRVTYEIATRLGSTTQVGQVQMYDGIDSTRTDLVATANAVRIAASMGGGGGGGTTAPMTYYVDGVAGNDANDGLTQATAVKTPQVAVDKLYDLSGGHLKHACTIRIKGAQTYTGTLFVSGFYGKGSLTITRYASETQSVLTGQITVSAISLREITVSYTSTQSILSFQSCLNANCLNVSITNSTPLNGIEATMGSTLLVANCTVSNRTSGIFSSNSRISSGSNSGTGNTVGLSASSAGVIGKNGSQQPTGTTAEGQSAGGVIR